MKNTNLIPTFFNSDMAEQYDLEEMRQVVNFYVWLLKGKVCKIYSLKTSNNSSIVKDSFYYSLCSIYCKM